MGLILIIWVGPKVNEFGLNKLIYRYEVEPNLLGLI